MDFRYFLELGSKLCKMPTKLCLFTTIKFTTKTLQTKEFPKLLLAKTATVLLKL